MKNYLILITILLAVILINNYENISNTQNNNETPDFSALNDKSDKSIK